MGAAIAGGKLGWEIIGIRDGSEGLLFPERYPSEGLLTLSPELIENLDPSTGGILGQATPEESILFMLHLKTVKKEISLI